MEETCFAINTTQQLELESDDTGVLDLMDHICRLCAKWKENLLHLFSEPAVRKSLVEMINLHLPLEVKNCDALPLHICDSCIKKVEVCHELIQTSLTSQTQLIELFAPLNETKSSEASTHNKLETNSSDLLFLACAEMEENNITIDQTNSYAGKRMSCYNIQTDLDLETSQSLIPGLAENSEKIDCVQESVYVENLKMDESTDTPTISQPCDLKFDDVDNLTSHHTANSSTVFYCWDCNILFYDKVEYENHILLHGVVTANDNINSAEMMISATEKIVECFGTREANTEHENLQYTLSLTNSSEAIDEVLTTLTKKAFEENEMEVGFEDGAFICEAGSSENVNGGDGQLVEGNPTDVDVTEDFFKDNVIVKLKVEFPLKDLQSNTTKEKLSIFNSADTNATLAAKEKPKQTYRCIYCVKTYGKKSRRDEHENFHTHEFIYTCNVCEKPYYTKNSLTNHLYTHNEEMKPLACKYEGCTKRFIRKILLDAHILSHTNEHNFICEICQVKFKQKKGLLRHKEAQHSEVTFPCTVCSKAYRTRYLLTDHMRSHLSNKLYKCGECGMEFHQANRRNQHLAVHATERKHKCHLCPSAFKRASHLSAHVKRHSRLHAYKYIIHTTRDGYYE